MEKLIKTFFDDTDGATTVDWVVLTAAILTINVFFVVSVVNLGVEANASAIAERIETARTAF